MTFFPHRRFIAAVPIITLSFLSLTPMMSGCSFIAVTPLPAEHAKMEYFACSDSSIAPLLDVAGTVLEVVRTVTAIGASEGDYQGKPFPKEADIFFGASLLALYAGSAAYGFSSVAKCGKAKVARGFLPPPKRAPQEEDDGYAAPPPRPVPARAAVKAPVAPAKVATTPPGPAPVVGGPTAVAAPGAAASAANASSPATTPAAAPSEGGAAAAVAGAPTGSTPPATAPAETPPAAATPSAGASPAPPPPASAAPVNPPADKGPDFKPAPPARPQPPAAAPAPGQAPADGTSPPATPPANKTSSSLPPLQVDWLVLRDRVGLPGTR